MRQTNLLSDDAVHEKLSVSLSRKIGNHPMYQRPTTLFRCPCYQAYQNILYHCSHPAHIISEDVTVTGARSNIVDDNV
jgi:hypothetical protein